MVGRPRLPHHWACAKSFESVHPNFTGYHFVLVIDDDDDLSVSRFAGPAEVTIPSVLSADVGWWSAAPGGGRGGGGGGWSGHVVI